jgi:hypothetical protein
MGLRPAEFHDEPLQAHGIPRCSRWFFDPVPACPRGRGLLIGIEWLAPARSYCERLKDLGLLCKETHDFVIRLAPPLIISARRPYDYAPRPRRRSGAASYS